LHPESSTTSSIPPTSTSTAPTTNTPPGDPPVHHPNPSRFSSLMMSDSTSLFSTEKPKDQNHRGKCIKTLGLAWGT
jgi:hypothetical protein